MRKISLFSLPVSSSQSIDASVRAMSEALVRKTGMFVTFINPYAFYLRAIDQGYANSLWHLDLVLADGIGVTKAVSWITGQSIERQSFDSTSLFGPVLLHLQENEQSIVILGGKPGVAEKAMAKMKRAFPGVRYLGAKNGFHDFGELVNWVEDLQPDVVLIGMGAPIQEKFLLRLKQSGFCGLGITCGGFLDQYIENSNYYPKIVDKLNIRFIYRLVKEPRRLARRYFIEYQHFIFDFVQAIINRNIMRR